MQNNGVTLVGVGDIMLGRGVSQCGRADAVRLLGPALRDSLRADIVTANLECLVTTRGVASRFSHSHFRTSPDFAEPLIRLFDVVTLANNHLFDFGGEAVDDTIEFLAKIGVRHVGIGRSPEEAACAASFERGSMRVDVYGASDVTNIPDGWSGVHVASVNELLLRRISESVSSGAMVVVHLHAGGGDVEMPSPRVYRLHEKLRKAGASVILGHHPHRVQGWCERDGTLSFFSLGDFVFDKLSEGRDSSLIARVELPSLEKRVSLVRREVDLVIDIAPAGYADPLMARLGGYSAKLQSGVDGALDSSHSLAGHKARLVSLWRDFRSGGFGAVLARIRHKLRKLSS